MKALDDDAVEAAPTLQRSPGASVSPLQSVAEEVQNNALGKRPLVSEEEERALRCVSECAMK